jgi:hypothetical protein
MSRAGRAEVSDAVHRAEIAAWVGGDRPDGTGVPSSSIPDQPPESRVQVRYFRPPGTLMGHGSRDVVATYAVLHGPADTAEARSWRCRPPGMATTRMPSGVGYAYLAMRLGYPDRAIPIPR